MKIRINISLLFSTLPLFILLFLVSACNQPDNSRESQAKKGKILFDKYCISCHGQHGDGPAAAGLKTKPADLTAIMKSRKSKQFPISEVARYIDGRATIKSHGTREMPVWGKDLMVLEKLNNNDELKGKLGEIIAYLMSIQQMDYQPSSN